MDDLGEPLQLTAAPAFGLVLGVNNGCVNCHGRGSLGPRRPGYALRPNLWHHRGMVAVVRPVNCHVTAAADPTSITESRPKLLRAVEDAIVPAVIATIASITL
jgi:hypothetical protein